MPLIAARVGGDLMEPNMSNFTRCTVKVADIVTTRKRGMSESDYLWAVAGDDTEAKRKVRKYARAMARGVEFTAVLLMRLDNKLWIDDGWHRAHAAALLRRKTIEAVIFDADTREEADALSEALIDLEFQGEPAWDALAQAAVRAPFTRAAHA